MGYFFKTKETKEKYVYELKMRNSYIFAAVFFLSAIPVAMIAAVYFAENVNTLRIGIVILMTIIYIALDGRAFAQILFKRNKTREGSIISFKYPLKYTVYK